MAGRCMAYSEVRQKHTCTPTRAARECSTNGPIVSRTQVGPCGKATPGVRAAPPPSEPHAKNSFRVQPTLSIPSSRILIEVDRDHSMDRSDHHRCQRWRRDAHDFPLGRSWLLFAEFPTVWSRERLDFPILFRPEDGYLEFKIRSHFKFSLVAVRLISWLERSPSPERAIDRQIKYAAVRFAWTEGDERW